MEDAHTIILPPEAAAGDDLGLRQVFELFTAASGLRWAELAIRARGSNHERTLAIGVPTTSSTSVDLEIDDDTDAVLTVDRGAVPSGEALDLLTGSLGRELHRLRLLAEATVLRGAIDATSAAVLLFGPTGQIVFANRRADELIAKQTEDELTIDWNGGGPQPLFRVICNQVGRLLEEGAHKQSVCDRLRVSNGAEVTFEFVKLETDTDGLGRVVLAVVREIGEPPDHLVNSYAAQHGLSPRERDVLQLLIRGYDTAGLAERLGISPHTVRDHLKNVFRKTSNRSRSEVLGALAGAGNHGR